MLQVEDKLLTGSKGKGGEDAYTYSAGTFVKELTHADHIVLSQIHASKAPFISMSRSCSRV